MSLVIHTHPDYEIWKGCRIFIKYVWWILGGVIYEQKKIGFIRLVETIGRAFFDDHKDSAVFSSGDTEKGLFCFLGIDLHTDEREATLSCSVDDWDIYASCYVLDDGEIEMDKCRLPINAGEL